MGRWSLSSWLLLSPALLSQSQATGSLWPPLFLTCILGWALSTAPPSISCVFCSQAPGASQTELLTPSLHLVVSWCLGSPSWAASSLCPGAWEGHRGACALPGLLPPSWLRPAEQSSQGQLLTSRTPVSREASRPQRATQTCLCA